MLLAHSLCISSSIGWRYVFVTGIITSMRSAVRAIIIKDDKMLVMSRNKFGHQYNILVGGAIGPGETAEQALVRQVKEETNLQVTEARPVFIDEAGAPYGTQYIYLCTCSDGEVVLSPDSEEAKINQLGQNLYTPQWISLSEFTAAPFRSERLQKAILSGIEHDFPQMVQTL
jgi:ADP-ribose pyrophosphatase YjhB (NUDIX family)